MSGTDIEVYDPDDDELPDDDPGEDVALTLERQLVPGRDEWEKQPFESMKAYHAFALYRDLGPTRSVAKVAGELNKSPSLIARWSRHNLWAIRKDAYDLYRDRTLRQAMEGEQDRARRRQAALGATLQGRVLERLQGNEQRNIQPIDWNEAGVNEIVRAAEVGTRIENLALGMATDAVRGVRDVPGHEVAKLARLLVEAAIVELEKAAPNVDSFLLRVDEIGRGQ